MLNPVLRFALLAASGLITASCVATQHPEPFRATVEQDPVDMRYRVLVESPAGPRLEIDMEAGPAGGAATLSHNGRLWRVTTVSCEAFRTALEKWRAFPSIQPGPAALRNDPPPTQIPPGLLHGYGEWTIRTEAGVPESQPVIITIYDPAGRYAIWAEETVRGIMRCPEGSRN